MWARLDDRFHLNRKQLAMSDSAFRLYVCGITYAANQEAAGFLGEIEVAALMRMLKKGRRQIDELVRLKAWEPVEGGWRIHDAEVYAAPLDRTSTERSRRYRGRLRDGVTGTVGDALRNGGTGTTPVPARPVPSRPEGLPPCPIASDGEVGVKKSRRDAGTNARAAGTNPRARSSNPRATGDDPRTQRKPSGMESVREILRRRAE